MIRYIWGDYFKTASVKLKTTAGGFTRLREVREYEVELYDTDGGISVINGKSYDIKKGNVLIAFPGDLRQSKPDFECYSVKFLCDDTEFISWLKEISGVNNCEKYKELIEVFKEIHFLSGKLGKEILIDARIRTVIAELYDSITEKKVQNNRYKVSLNKALSFINASLAKKINLSDIAEASGLSVSHFHKIFKEAYSMSPCEYLTAKRVENAKSLLVSELISIDEVAEKCGFFSRAYFDVSFKKVTGITPAGFRKSFNDSGI